MRYLDYSQLEALAAVATTRSFDGAAQALGVTQSAVSQKIKQLESRVGAILVVRGRPCRVTPLGQRLCSHLNQVEILEVDLREALSLGERRNGNGKVRTFRVAVNHDSLITWFPGVISRASRDLDIRFDIIANDQDHTAEHLKQGEVNAAVSSDAGSVHGYRKISLGNLTYTAVASPHFVQTRLHDGVTLATLSRVPSLVYTPMDMRLRNWCRETFGSFPDLDAHAVPSFQGYRQCCLEGVGWGILPTASIRSEIDEKRLVRITPDTDIKVPIYWHYSGLESDTLKNLSSIVRKVAREHLAVS